MFIKAKRITLGTLALLLGVAGAVLPVIPGWPFFLFALVLLSRDVPPLRPLRRRMEKRFPRLRGPVARWEAKLGLIDPAEAPTNIRPTVLSSIRVARRE